MKYILNYTLGESLEYTEENLVELQAFGYNYEIVKITPKGAEVLEIVKMINKKESAECHYRTKLI